MSREHNKKGFSGLLSFTSDLGEAVGGQNKHEHPQRPRKSITKPGPALLHMAVWRGRAEEIKELLSAGAQLDAKDEKGRTPLDIAVQHGHGEEIKKLLSGDGQGTSEQARVVCHQAPALPVSTGLPKSSQRLKGAYSEVPQVSARGVSLAFRLLARLFIPGVLLLLISYCSQQDSDKTSTASSYTQLSPSAQYSPSQTPEAQGADLELKFSEPPVGDDNVLSIAQIRWCLREEIRIEALRPMATTNPQIDQFNLVVDNYNRRCGSYRYDEGTLTRAQQELETMRPQVVAGASLY